MNPSEGESYGPALGVWCSRPRDRARKCHAGWPRSRRWAVVGGRLMICFRPRATLWCPRRGGDLRVPRGEGGWRGAPVRLAAMLRRRAVLRVVLLAGGGRWCTAAGCWPMGLPPPDDS